MTREQLEHVIRASGAIAGVSTLVIIGSRAILASFPDAPDELRGSMVADLYPPDEPQKADVIDGAIGEESPFHEEFGCYAHGVGPETVVLPAAWQRRAVRLRSRATHGVTAIWPAAPDLAVSKLAAGRQKDIEFVRALVRLGLVPRAAIVRAAAELPAEHRAKVEDALALVR